MVHYLKRSWITFRRNVRNISEYISKTSNYSDSESKVLMWSFHIIVKEKNNKEAISNDWYLKYK